MKLIKSLYLIGLGGFLLTSCNQAEIDKLTKEKTDLQEQLLQEKELSAMKDSSINQFFESFAEIENSLEEIRAKEEGLAKLSVKGDIKNNKKEQIISDINSMGEMLAENKNRISNLNRLLKKTNINSEKLEQTINSLEERILTKDSQISKLTKNLSNANSALSALNKLYIDKVKENTQLTDNMNKAYYAFGTYKELKEKNVVNKEGGIIGIGSTKELAQDFNKEYFKEIDIRETKNIDLYAEKAEMATDHPSDSYELIADEEGMLMLKINDAKKFWSVSNYLVIITK